MFLIRLFTSQKCRAKKFRCRREYSENCPLIFPKKAENVTLSARIMQISRGLMPRLILNVSGFVAVLNVLLNLKIWTPKRRGVQKFLRHTSLHFLFPSLSFMLAWFIVLSIYTSIPHIFRSLKVNFFFPFVLVHTRDFFARLLYALRYSSSWYNLAQFSTFRLFAQIFSWKERFFKKPARFYRHAIKVMNLHPAWVDKS